VSDPQASNQEHLESGTGVENMVWKRMTMIAVMITTTVTVCDDAIAGQAWICSVASAVAVDEDGTIGPPDLGERARPTFFRLDAEKKELTLLGPDSRRGEVTKLETVKEVDGHHVFSGVENGRVVSVIIAAEGRMTLSIINDGVVWSVFGHALPTTELK
jgi:hypothetical protein